ncbi:hypothetical protein GCM10010533_42600 [Mycolicibacterium pallens]
MDPTPAAGAAVRRAATAFFCGPRVAAVVRDDGFEWAALDCDEADDPPSAAAIPHPTVIDAPTPTAISAPATQPEHGKPETGPRMSTPRSDNASRPQIPRAPPRTPDIDATYIASHLH